MKKFLRFPSDWVLFSQLHDATPNHHTTMKTTMTTAQRAEELVASTNFPEFYASIHQGKLGDIVLTTTRKMVYLRGKSRAAFRLVSCGRFLRIAAGKEAWI